MQRIPMLRDDAGKGGGGLCHFGNDFVHNVARNRFVIRELLRLRRAANPHFQLLPATWCDLSDERAAKAGGLSPRTARR
jgi:hypothetical protein